MSASEERVRERRRKTARFVSLVRERRWAKSVEEEGLGEKWGRKGGSRLDREVDGRGSMLVGGDAEWSAKGEEGAVVWSSTLHSEGTGTWCLEKDVRDCKPQPRPINDS